MSVDEDVTASVIEIRFDTATTICDEVDKAEKDKMTSVNKKKVSQALALAGTIAQVQTPAHTPTHAHYTLHAMPPRAQSVHSPRTGVSQSWGWSQTVLLRLCH